MIKLAVSIMHTCFRAPYGDIDDRIPAIAHAFGLRVILWQSDSNDWLVGTTPTVTPAMVDANYQSLVTAAQNGTFNFVSIPPTSGVAQLMALYDSSKGPSC